MLFGSISNYWLHLNIKVGIVETRQLLAHDLFNLENYQHASLFDSVKDIWQALNNISDYLGTLHLGTIEADVQEGVHLYHQDQIYIGKGTIIESGAYIKGPCYIGENCIISHGAYIRGNVITGNGCRLGHASEFKNSILLNNVSCAHFNYVGDSILGNNVMFGAGVKCANLRLDRKSLRIKINNDIIETGLEKLGLIAADDCSIGCNTVTNPGTILEPNVKVGPCTSVGGYITGNQTC